MREVAVGPLVYVLGEDAWLSEQGARYALARLWSLMGSEPFLGRTIRFDAVPWQRVRELKEASATSVEWIDPSSLVKPSPLAGDLLPLLLRTHPALVRDEPDGWRVGFDLPGLLFYVMTRQEELGTKPSHDSLGRFGSLDGLAGRLGLVERPVLDEWALLVRTVLLERLGAGPVPPAPLDVGLTHDLDHPLWFSSGAAALRHGLGAAWRTRDPRAVIRVAEAAFRCWLDWHRDPFVESLDTMLGIAERHGIQTVCYVMAAHPGSLDEGYDVSREPYRSIIATIRSRGHHLGLHPSVADFGDAGALQRQLGALQEVAGVPVERVRQHYLMFDGPQTWSRYASASLRRDAGLAFHDHAGFRAWTSHPFPAYDPVADRELPVLVEPLIVMDGMLRKHQNLDPHEVPGYCRTLAERCRRVGGRFSILWHPSSTSTDYWRGWDGVYEAVVNELLG